MNPSSTTTTITPPKINYAELAHNQKLTTGQILKATQKQLIEDKYGGDSVIYNAARYCSIEIVQALLQRGIDINTTSSNNLTPLIGASGNKKWDTVLFLLSHGADGKLTTNDGYNALHAAAREGAPTEILKALIDAGVDPTAKNHYKETPIDKARVEGNMETVEYLEMIINRPVKSANWVV
jgi:ankyrin repeat protein